jgi:hypothetical protein
VDRSPGWDGFWTLSELSVGLVLTILGNFNPTLPLTLLLAALLVNGHALAPILAAWNHPAFRAAGQMSRSEIIAGAGGRNRFEGTLCGAARPVRR